MIIISRNFRVITFNFGFLFFLVMIACNVFPLFLSGLSRKRKYSNLGSFRGAAQVIAYEVKATILLLFPFILVKRFRAVYYQTRKGFVLLRFPLILIFWLFCILSETKRAPFDFAEGERELVSGFNTEYRGLNFTFLFLAEYRKIIVMSIISSLLFFSKRILISLLFIYLFIGFRASFPRFRYDLLMVFG